MDLSEIIVPPAAEASGPARIGRLSFFGNYRPPLFAVIDPPLGAVIKPFIRFPARGQSSPLSPSSFRCGDSFSR